VNTDIPTGIYTAQGMQWVSKGLTFHDMLEYYKDDYNSAVFIDNMKTITKMWLNDDDKQKEDF